jgi:hypothetical protein
MIAGFVRESVKILFLASAAFGQMSLFFLHTINIHVLEVIDNQSLYILPASFATQNRNRIRLAVIISYLLPLCVIVTYISCGVTCQADVITRCPERPYGLRLK